MNARPVTREKSGAAFEECFSTPGLLTIGGDGREMRRESEDSEGGAEKEPAGRRIRDGRSGGADGD